MWFKGKLPPFFKRNRKNQDTATNPTNDHLDVQTEPLDLLASPALHDEDDATAIAPLAVSAHAAYRSESADQVANGNGRSSAPIAIAVATNPPVTNCVEFIYTVMDDLLPQLEHDLGTYAETAVRSATGDLLRAFSPAGRDAGTIVEYDSAAHRLAYLYRYATVRAAAAYSVMNKFLLLEEMRSREHLRVCCVGGGPGTELIGLSKYLNPASAPPRITATILDKCAGWSETWQAIRRRLPESPYIDTTYLQRDFEDQSGRCQGNEAIHADLYTLSYCLAEFRDRHQFSEEYFEALFQSALPGSYILFLDINFSEEYSWFERMVCRSGFELLPDRFGKCDNHCSVELLSADELLTTQAGYKGMWGMKSPRADPAVAYRLARKM